MLQTPPRLLPVYRSSFAKVGSTVAVTSLALPAFTVVPGSSIIVAWRGAGGGGSPTVTDTLGNTYVNLANGLGHDPTMRLWVASYCVGGPNNVVTVSFASTTFVWATAVQYVGAGAVLASGALAPAGGTVDLTTSPITTSDGAILVAAFSQNTTVPAYVAGTNFVLLDGSLNATIDAPTFFFGGIEEYISPTPLAAFTGHITSTSSNQYTTVWAALRRVP